MAEICRRMVAGVSPRSFKAYTNSRSRVAVTSAGPAAPPAKSVGGETADVPEIALHGVTAIPRLERQVVPEWLKLKRCREFREGGAAGGAGHRGQPMGGITVQQVTSVTSPGPVSHYTNSLSTSLSRGFRPMPVRRPTLPLMLLGLLAACNSSTSPNATVVGTWHVSVGAVDSGSVAPTTFNFVVTASGDSFLITAPTLTWSVGTLTFDSTVSMIHFSSATYFGFQEIPKVGSAIVPGDPSLRLEERGGRYAHVGGGRHLQLRHHSGWVLSARGHRIRHDHEVAFRP